MSLSNSWQTRCRRRCRELICIRSLHRCLHTAILVWLNRSVAEQVDTDSNEGLFIQYTLPSIFLRFSRTSHIRDDREFHILSHHSRGFEALHYVRTVQRR